MITSKVSSSPSRGKDARLRAAAQLVHPVARHATARFAGRKRRALFRHDFSILRQSETRANLQHGRPRLDARKGAVSVSVARIRVSDVVGFSVRVGVGVSVSLDASIPRLRL